MANVGEDAMNMLMREMQDAERAEFFFSSCDRQSQ